MTNDELLAALRWARRTAADGVKGRAQVRALRDLLDSILNESGDEIEDDTATASQLPDRPAKGRRWIEAYSPKPGLIYWRWRWIENGRRRSQYIGKDRP